VVYEDDFLVINNTGLIPIRLNVQKILVYLQLLRQHSGADAGNYWWLSDTIRWHRSVDEYLKFRVNNFGSIYPNLWETFVPILYSLILMDLFKSNLLILLNILKRFFSLFIIVFVLVRYVDLINVRKHSIYSQTPLLRVPWSGWDHWIHSGLMVYRVFLKEISPKCCMSSQFCF
jgi:hypothetical protein